MRNVIFMPYRETKERRPLFKAAHAQASLLGLPIFVGDAEGEIFSIARTWNKLSKEAGEWDRAIFWGADFVLENPQSIYDALDSDHHYIRAFNKATRLTLNETRSFLRDKEYPHLKTSKLPFSGVRAVSREAFETVKGYDERFEGWGHEDRVFVHCVETLVGPTDKCVPGRMIMLKHKGRKHRPDDIYYGNQKLNSQMWQEYRKFRKPDELIRHIDSVR